MSSADPAEVSMVVSRDGVTVEKSFEPDDFPVPAIAFVIRAERDEAVTVRISDEVPEQVAAEDIGFHPKYGAEFWSVDEGNIVFEREFESGEEYTTVYGLRASQTDDVESYMSEPTLEDVDPPLDDAGQVVREVIGDDVDDADDGGDDATTGAPSSDDIEAAIAAADADEGDDELSTDADDDDGPVEPLTLNDPNGGGGDVEPNMDVDAVEAASDDTPDPDDATVDQPPVDGDPVAAIAQQVREGTASESDLAALRQALGTGSDGSTDARIKQLQSELADLRAYTSALEEFLDENGDAQRLIEDVTGSVERIDRQLSSVESRADSAVTRVGEMEGGLDRVDSEVDELAGELSAARERVDAVEAEMEEFTETVDGVEREVDEMGANVDAVETRVDDLDDTVETVESDVEGLHSDVEEFTEELSTVHSTVEDVQEDVSEVESEVDGVHDTVDELAGDIESVEDSLDRVDDLDDRLETLESEFEAAREDLESLSQMREQLSSVFGAQVQGPGDDADDAGDGDDAE